MFNPEVQKQSVFIDQIGIDETIQRLELLIPNDQSGLYLTLPGPGEPTESPHFLRLSKYFLSKNAILGMSSNLNGIKDLEALAASVPAGTIKDKTSIGLSYHLGTYLDRPHGDEMRQHFLDSFKRLVELGYNVVQVTTPMTPKVLDSTYEQDIAWMKTLTDIEPYPVGLVHLYNGIRYPEAYTPDESKKLAEIQERLHIKQPDVTEWTAEQIPWLTSWLELKGQPCQAFARSVEILIDGRMRHCQAGPQEATVFGNFTSFDTQHPPKLFGDNPTLCPADQCQCRGFGEEYCLKLQGKTLKDYYRELYAKKARVLMDEANRYDGISKKF